MPPPLEGSAGHGEGHTARFANANSGGWRSRVVGTVAVVKQLDASVADPATSGAYPIPSYSWLLLYPHYPDKNKAGALHDFVEWGLSQRAQDGATQLGYLPLPADVIGLGREDPHGTHD